MTFSGGRSIDVGALPADTVMGIDFDGVGSKIEIAARMGIWPTVVHHHCALFLCWIIVGRGRMRLPLEREDYGRR